MMTAKRVAVVGGGPSGIGSMKCLLEEDIEPVCFERTGHFGGLWRYHDEDVEGLASVMKTTVINSSKEMGALSDVTPPDDFPNYMHNTEIYQCMKMLVEKLGLEKYIRYNKEVIRVEKASDYESTGHLTVRTKDTKTGEIEEDVYDGVFVCTGHHVYPNIPTFPGQEKFNGKIMHTHSLKSVDSFVNQVVVVVGTGNSGMDAAVEASSVAQKVYLSTRRGTWVLPRVGPNGTPFDMAMSSRFLFMFFEWLPLKVSSWFMERMLNNWFDHSMYNLKPNHGFFSQHPTVSDTLPVKLLSGVVKVRGNIKVFTEDGVIFENETQVTKADSVILATGYRIIFPFLSEDLATVKNNRVHLYKFMYPPHLPHPTLVLIGLIQSLGAGFPVAEAQSRLASFVMNGKVKLPNRKDMEADIKRYNDAIDKRYVRTERHTIQVDYISYLDEICDMFGAKPNLLKILFTDPRLFVALIFGPSLPYQYRLQGPHSWPGARDAILSYKKRVVKPLKKSCKNQFDHHGFMNAISKMLFVAANALLSMFSMN